MMVNELGNTLGGMAVARDYRATRMTLFDFCMARQEVKPTLKFGFQVIVSLFVKKVCVPA